MPDQADILREQWNKIIEKLKEEFDEGPVGVTLAPGEGALLYRVLQERGLA